MGFNPPVPQQDSNLEIRVTILLSAIFQVILVFVSPLRKRSSSTFSRFIIWSCYLLADWVADLTLGLLLNNMGNIGGGGGSRCSVDSHVVPSSNSNSPIIFAFWAPFLLLHMGGPDTITAYSLEDNELWRRHLISFLFETSAAALVFFCSLKDNPMIVATPIIFLAGIIKYVERTYSLYYGSTDGFPVTILVGPEDEVLEILRAYRIMQAYSSRKKGGAIVELVTLRDSSDVFWEMDLFVNEMSSTTMIKDKDVLDAYNLFINYRPIFFNGVVSTRNRRISEAFYLDLGHCNNIMKAFQIIEMELNYMYDMLYTKMPVLQTRVGYVLRFVSCICIVSSFIIFASHDKVSMLPADIGITYVLLTIAVVLEAAALVKLLFSNWMLVFVLQNSVCSLKLFYWLVIWKIKNYFLKHQQATRSRKIWQLNLMDHSLQTVQRDNYHGFFLRKLPKVINRLWNKPVHSDMGNDKTKYEELLNFIFERIKEIVTKSTTSEQRKEACQARGEKALRKLVRCFKKDKRHNIESTIIFKSVTERDYDESLLIWHIATDLCLSCRPQEDTCDTLITNKMKLASKCISEYLLYLLIKKPEMTYATMGIGHLCYNNTCEVAKLLFRPFQDILNGDHGMACKMVLQMAPAEDHFVKGDRTKTVLFNASILAHAMKDSFTDQEAMWRVIAHVWIEMLIFTASQTQPREHLKTLSDGGELITMVWLLMAHMGVTSSSFEVQETESINKLIIHDQ